MTRRKWGMLALAVAALVIVGIVVAVALAGGTQPVASRTPTPAAEVGPRPLTTAEAERLAVARFLAYQDGSREFRTEVTTSGTTLSLHGRVDYRATAGIAATDAEGEPAVITWNERTLIGWEEAGNGEDIPAQAPVEPGAARAIDPRAGTIDSVLLLLLGLGADRPDNAQLLRQSDAAWLRAEDLDGTHVDVFTGPSDAGSGADGGTTRFWVDDRGALRRFEADLPAGTVVIDLLLESYTPVPVDPQFG